MWFLSALPFLASVTSPAMPLSAGERLPDLKGEFLSGKSALLPQAAEGRVALLLLGFTYDSRFPVEAWTSRFRREFGNDSRVTFYEIPMIGGWSRLGKWFIDSGMRRGTPRPDQEHVITVYGGTLAWKQRVGFERAADAYLILLDAGGNVAWRHAGAPTEDAFKSLAAKVRELAP